MKNLNAIQDFLDHDSFILWVNQKEENSFWDDFLIEYPEKAEIYNEAVQLAKSLYSIEFDQLSCQSSTSYGYIYK